VWHIYLLMFFRAVTGIFHWTAMQASTSMLVPKEHLSRVQGLNQMLNGMMNIGAAPLGALLMGLLPMQGVLMIDVSTAAIAILPLFFIAIPQPPRSQPEENPAAPSLRRELAAGFKYVWAWPGLLAIMFMATVINLLLTPVSSLQPILVTNYFKGEAFHLAWMEAAWGIGVVMGGLVLSAWGGFRRRVLTSMLGIVLLGVSVLGVGLVPANMFPLAVVLMFVVGFSNPITNGPLFAILQAIVAPDMQGRVFTLIGSVATAATPLGLLAAGPLADQFGVRVWYGVAGVITLLLAAGALLTPLIMNVEERPAPVSASPEPAAAPAD
jgi:DHA3 family macrolide efflux protein-like MFS transporter